MEHLVRQRRGKTAESSVVPSAVFFMPVSLPFGCKSGTTEIEKSPQRRFGYEVIASDSRSAGRGDSDALRLDLLGNPVLLGVSAGAGRKPCRSDGAGHVHFRFAEKRDFASDPRLSDQPARTADGGGMAAGADAGSSVCDYGVGEVSD